MTESNNHSVHLPTLWQLTHWEEDGVATIANQAGIATHEEVTEIIKSLQKFYSSVSPIEIEERNSKPQRGRGDLHIGGNKSLEPDRRTLKGYIYMIQAGDSTFYKIGMSADPARRLKDLQASNPNELTLAFTLKTEDMMLAEAAIHRKYDPKRISGEWFNLSESEVAEICSYKEGDL